MQRTIDNIEFKTLYAHEAKDSFAEIASLRIKVFAEFPYLYDGDIEYEKAYLKTYTQSQKSCFILAVDRNTKKIIGASTAIALADGDEEFKKPFVNSKYTVDDVFYFGESVLLKEYRGLGIGKKFMQLRTKFAAQFPRIKYLSFCTVIRPTDHPLRPKDYRALDTFWQQQGFRIEPQLISKYSWKDIDENQETEKDMQFWVKKI